MIGIIDYEVGNLFSLGAALTRLGSQYKMVGNRGDLEDCTALILPGVGAFGDAMKSLQAKKLDQVVVDWANSGRPLLGICLGMQLLFASSEEYGEYQGLGLIPGTVQKIPPGLKIPHMGWNELMVNKSHLVLQGFSEGYVYFVHSYYAVTPQDYVIAVANYGQEIPAIVGRDNILGMQFHPEKSGEVGMNFLNNWVNEVKK